MKVFQENGRTIIRSPEVLAYLSAQIRETDELVSPVPDIRLNIQEYGIEAVHGYGLHVPSNKHTVVKVGASEREIFWMNALSEKAPDLIPEVLLSGHRLGELQIGWIATEAIRYNAIGTSWGGNEFRLLVEAGVKFQKVAQQVQDESLPTVDKGVVLKWLERGLGRNLPGPVARVLDRFDQDYEWVTRNCEFVTCHGDLHLCNGVTRNPPPDGPALLIDIEPVKQPWAFDAAYLQILNSGDKTRPGYQNLVHMMWDYRRQYGLSVCSPEHMDQLSRITLGWYAIYEWNQERAETQPDYIEECSRYIEECASL